MNNERLLHRCSQAEFAHKSRTQRLVFANFLIIFDRNLVLFGTLFALFNKHNFKKCCDPFQAALGRGWTQYLEFHIIKQGLGLSTASLLAFVIGLACVLAAVVCGFIYSQRNVLEWQAVQVYRMEWLLGAVAAFVGGLLLRKSTGSEK